MGEVHVGQWWRCGLWEAAPPPTVTSRMAAASCQLTQTPRLARRAGAANSNHIISWFTRLSKVDSFLQTLVAVCKYECDFRWCYDTFTLPTHHRGEMSNESWGDRYLFKTNNLIFAWWDKLILYCVEGMKPPWKQFYNFWCLKYMYRCMLHSN